MSVEKETDVYGENIRDKKLLDAISQFAEPINHISVLDSPTTIISNWSFLR